MFSEYRLPGTFTQDPLANITIGMRDLFKQLDKAGDDGIQPIIFTNLMRLAYPQFAQQVRGHFAQQDAEECFSSLVTALEQNLKVDGSANEEGFVKKYMTGRLKTTMTCDEAPEEAASIGEESFVRLSCHISQQVNFLAQGLKEVNQVH